MRKGQLLVVFIVALVIRLAAAAVLGPRVSVDSVGYIESGRAFLASGPAALTTLQVEHAPLYSLVLVAGLLVPSIDVGWLVVLTQSVLGAATAVIVARLTARETSSPTAGLCAGAICSVQITFVFWTVYVLAETLFLFLLAVCADRVLLLRRSVHPARDSLMVGVLALLSVAARPTGAAFLLALPPLLPMAAHGSCLRLVRLLAGFCLPFALVGLLAVGALSVGSAQPSANATRVVDWVRSALTNGLLWTESARGTSGVDLDVYPPPIVETLPADQRAEFLQAGPLAFAARHPEFVAAQTARKLRMFWTPVLPEYSLPHAVLTSLYFIPFYVLAVLGSFQGRRFPALVTLSALSVLLFTLTSLITFVDYDQRYRLPAELFLIPVAAAGLAWLIRRQIGWQPADG